MENLTIYHFIPLISHVMSTDVMMLANIVEAVAVYAPIGLLIYLISFRPKDINGRAKWPSFFLPCVLCGILGVITEIIQLWMPARTSNIEDVIYAAFGGYVGVSAAILYYYYRLKNVNITVQP